MLRALLLLGLTLSVSFSAAAGTVHKVRFAQSAKVLVWQDGTWIGQGHAIDLSRTAADLPAMYLGSGRLDPVETSTKDKGSITLEIASNSGFVITAASSTPGTQITARLIGISPNASSSARSMTETFLHSGEQTIFTQSQKTATRPGDVSTQTIRIELRWSSSTQPDFAVRVQ